jgi:Uma2 family endonuclease
VALPSLLEHIELDVWPGGPSEIKVVPLGRRAMTKDLRRTRLKAEIVGTMVVWDVDVLREGLVRVYRADDPEHPTVYRRGELAEAEPAVPGWTMAVDELFR